jgi:hypothetical protein
MVSRLRTRPRPHLPSGDAPQSNRVAARLDPGGEFDIAITCLLEDGLIARTHAVRNPHELGRLDTVVELRR